VSGFPWFVAFALMGGEGAIPVLRIGPAGWDLIARAARGGSLATLGLAGTATALTAARALTAAPVVPGPLGALLVVVGLLPAALSLALPVGVLVGVAMAARAWREGGELAGLHAMGMPARRLVPALLLIGAVGGAVEAGLTHGLEPAGRTLVRRTVANASASLMLRPGQAMTLGPVLVRAERVSGDSMEQVFIATGDVVLTGQVGAMESDNRLRLDRGSARHIASDGSADVSLEFGRAWVPLAMAAPRVERGERSTPDLNRLVARIVAEGRPATAESLALTRRSAVPIALPLLALLGFPLGARGLRPAVAATVTVLGWWTLQRLADQSAPELGPTWAAWLPTLALLMAATLAWATWRDR
jgi:lipopolysaccharide export LptBFGC system permease protein LptF